MDKGVLVVVSGLSGAGKGTICKRLLEKYPDYVLSVSATSRKPRKGEENGREYFFITKEEFEEMIRDGKLLEYARYVENYYGTPREWVEQQLESGKNIILEIELQGAFQVREKIPDAVLIFILPPDMDELKRRLINRGTETMEEIEKRLERAVEEMAFIPEYDYVIVNDEVEKSVDMLHNIVRSEKEKESEEGE
ncbi:MAG: guanylate kinase [Lachnospiraceae bacterium]|nr:guanylate kinase [Lachnospiraceae bacterium]